MATFSHAIALMLALVPTLVSAPARAGQIAPEGLSSLPKADIYLLGEIHDNPVHHLHQAQAVTALRPTALVFEMLTPEQAADGAGQMRGDAEALARALGWDGTGWPDFSLYHPIFLAAPDAALYGAALPRAQVRQAVSVGAAALFGDGAARFGLTDPLPASEQSAREAEQALSHCNAMPADLMPGMVEAQRLRDAAFARTALQALADTGGPIAVITGTGHVRRDWGMPAAFARAAPTVQILSIGQTETDPGPDAPFDLWIVTEPMDRPDPCAALLGQG